MRLLRAASTALLAVSASSSPRANVRAFALPSHGHRHPSNALSGPSLLSAVVATIVAASSTSSVAAAGQGSEGRGECNETAASDESTEGRRMYDLEYPGTAVRRLRAVHERVSVIAGDGSLDGPWEEARRRILWAGGLRDLPDARPGQGYTGHSFNDFNHVDLTAMNDDSSDNLNDGSVKGIAIGNRLGPGIRVASIPELGPGGSWSTCAMGCNEDPPGDVAHVQFRSRIAFKLVWVPNEEYDTFVLVDDGGRMLARGKPSDGPEKLPRRREREMNYRVVKGSKYATVAESIASLNSTRIE